MSERPDCPIKPRPPIHLPSGRTTATPGRGMKNEELMTEYIFERLQADKELVRLQMIDEALDLKIIAHIETTGLSSGARCLELGAGAGYIMKWMRSVSGASGRVVGADREHAVLLRLIDIAKGRHQHRFSNQRDRMVRSLRTVGVRRDHVRIRDQTRLSALLQYKGEWEKCCCH